MKRIKKKVLSEYYHAVRKRRKTFEIRKDDSDYEVGDIIELYELDGQTQELTGHKLTREITYILRDVPQYGLMQGYCILAIQPIGWNDEYYAAAPAGAGQKVDLGGIVLDTQQDPMIARLFGLADD